MDNALFDDMVRAVSHRNTRRGALGALAGGLLRGRDPEPQCGEDGDGKRQVAETS